MRNIKFENGDYYHIYNRGVDKREIFLCDEDYKRFLKGMKEFNAIKPIGSLYEKAYKDKKEPAFQLEDGLLEANHLVEIVCYCLIPNHFHLILKQIKERGIERYMQKIGTSYTNYFNLKYKRSGYLFQGRYKSAKINSNPHILWLSVYVNCNSQIHRIINNYKSYKWSGFQEYLNQNNRALCNNNLIINQFKDIKDYEKYINEILPIIKEKKEIEKCLIENTAG